MVRKGIQERHGTIKSLCIYSNKIHVSNCKSEVPGPKCFLIASDNLCTSNDKTIRAEKTLKEVYTINKNRKNNKYVDHTP